MRFLLILVCLASSVAALARPDITAKNVVVVANENDKDSLAIAEYYMSQRDIPAKNLVTLPFPNEERISGETYVSEILNPLREKLIAEGWIKAYLRDAYDEVGRRRMLPQGHEIGYLVLCRLPYQIANYSAEHRAAYQEKSQMALQPANAAVDSELSLLLLDEMPVGGPLSNPLFQQKEPKPQIEASIIKVARLDGPSVAAVKRMIDSAIIGEQKGMRGRGYVDMGGPHKQGEDWLEECIRLLEAMNFPVSVDREKARFPWTARMDAPAFYIGWWTHTPDGAFQERSYRLPPGSVAIHISSFSGQQLRKPNNRWSGALVERGVAATVGNVYEPYLGLTHQPHLFFSGLEDGMQAGQAAYYSLTGLSWNAIFIGDPLYQPSKVTLEQQLASLSVDDPWDQYVVLRKAEQIRAADGDDAAFTFLQRNYHRAPGLALSYAIAQGWESRSERQKGIETLEFVAGLPAFSPEDMGLAYQIADLLIQMQARETGYKILKVLANQARTDDAKIAFMQPAIPIAQQLGDRDQASQWQATVDGILQKRQEEAERRKAAREAKKKAAAN